MPSPFLNPMGYLNNLKRKLEALEATAIASDVLAQNEQEIEQAQREQMLRGENNEGGVIGYYRNPSYADIKYRMNPGALGTVDLKLTGEFQSKITASIIGGELVIDSFSANTEEIREAYPKAFGLNAESKEQLITEHLKGDYKKKIEQATGLRFRL